MVSDSDPYRSSWVYIIKKTNIPVDISHFSICIDIIPGNISTTPR